MSASARERKVDFSEFTSVSARPILSHRGKVVRIDYRVKTRVDAHNDWVREAIVLACEAVIYGNTIGEPKVIREKGLAIKYPLVEARPHATMGDVQSHIINPNTIRIEGDELKRKLELVIVTAGTILGTDITELVARV